LRAKTIGCASTRPIRDHSNRYGRPDLCQRRNLGIIDFNAAPDGWHASDRRLGTPNDIAKGIIFLSSDDAGFMTGAGLVADGGPTAQ
jgi:NAD(P)-dependent dehydrogenase (short-subunit alcohol dehydrogenase family)